MKKVWYIYDGNEYYDTEDYTEEELNNLLNTVTCETWEEVREATKDLIRDYYEPSSKYGDPISCLLRYVPDSKISDLLEEFNYYLKEKEV